MSKKLYELKRGDKFSFTMENGSKETGVYLKTDGMYSQVQWDGLKDLYTDTDLSPHNNPPFSLIKCFIDVEVLSEDSSL